MSRRTVVALAAAIGGASALAAACGYDGAATANGSDGGPGSRDAATDQDPPACDPTREPTCLALPQGWTFVAGDLGAGGRVVENLPCPAGFDGPSEAGEGPTPAADACVCSTCNVTKQGSCAGPIQLHYSNDDTCSFTATALPNDPTDQCAPTPQPQVDATGARVKLTPPTAGAGTCATAPATAYADRVTFAVKGRLCRGAARCSGGTCDARLDPPYRACISNPAADAACPSGFPERHVLGAAAAFDCGACAGCFASTSCAGSADFFTDTECTAGKINVVVDDTCRAPPFGGTYRSYRYAGVATTTCATPTTNPAATNPRMTAARTVCCR